LNFILFINLRRGSYEEYYFVDGSAYVHGFSYVNEIDLLGKFLPFIIFGELPPLKTPVNPERLVAIEAVKPSII